VAGCANQAENFCARSPLIRAGRRIMYKRYFDMTSFG
jgi:hypothetical protein